MNTPGNYNILVTGVGAIIGYGIIESLRSSGYACTIVGADIYEENYGKYICDAFEQAPYSSDPGYLGWLEGVVRKHSIDLIMPGIEQDLYLYNRHRDRLPVRTVLNKQPIIDMSEDKWATFQLFQSLDAPFLIPTRLNIGFDEALGLFGLPFIIKPRKSYASKGFYVIRSEADYREHAAGIDENTLFQPCVGSAEEEYTFSIFGDGKGGYIDRLILRRQLSQEGATSKAVVIKEDPVLETAARQIAAYIQPEGPTNLQFRKGGDRAWLLEINPRISSACSIRSKFGYNEPAFCIEHYLLGGKYTLRPKRSGKAIRFINDHIVYE